jgi:hypothetical protein
MAARRSESSPLGPILLILGLVLGIPLLLVALCGVGFLLVTWMIGRAAVQVVDEVAKMPPPQIVIEHPNKDPFGKQKIIIDPFNPNNLVPNPPPQPPPPAGMAGKTMVDLIPMVNTQIDAVHGRWTIKDNVLHCPEGNFVPRIQIPYQPPREYDFIVVFSQPNLRNGVSLIMPNPNPNMGSFFWYVGSENGSCYGIHANPIKEGRLAGLVKPNTVCTTTVQVRNNSVKGIVDGKQLIHHPTNFLDLTSDNWRELRDKSLVAVACDDPTVFHHVRIVEITGKGRKIR